MTEGAFVNHILVVDNEDDLSRTIASSPESAYYQIVRAGQQQNALQRLASEKFDIVLIRERLPDGDIQDLINQILSAPVPPAVIVVGTGKDLGLVKKLLQNGVFEYFVEDLPPAALYSLFKNILSYEEQTRQIKTIQSSASRQLKDKGIIGSSQALHKCLDLVAKAGPSEANVLITGESGTGKELFAQAIHTISPHADKDIVVVDCASLPDNLSESILFGHVRGAFTGADRISNGLIRQSHGSTLFLDEIGELPPDHQKKFLRILQERKVRPVGSSRTFNVDFRLITATNKDLQQLVIQGLFREDLFFRLKTMHLDLPPLRDRLSDLTELAYFFMDNYCKTAHLKPKRFSSEFLVVLRRYHWPGNVREMFNVLESAIILAMESDILLPIHLPISIRVQAIENLRKNQADPDEIINAVDNTDPEQFPSLLEVRDIAVKRVESKYFRELLHHSRGDIKKACKTAAISRSRFYTLLKKYNISPS